jgi:hypothetical protein
MPHFCRLSSFESAHQQYFDACLLRQFIEANAFAMTKWTGMPRRSPQQIFPWFSLSNGANLSRYRYLHWSEQVVAVPKLSTGTVFFVFVSGQHHNVHGTR